MPVPVLLLVLEKKKKHRKPEKSFWLISRVLPLILYRVTDIYSRWPTESGLVGQGFAIESKDSVLKPHQALCQA